jgi:CelD/BcsL family acetyltransferase involved in cellulose biosynthesis
VTTPFQLNLVSARDIEPLLALRTDWDELLALAPGYSYCQTADYCITAARESIRLGAKIHLITLREDRRLVGLWVLAQRREGLLRVLRPLGCGSNEEYAWPLVRSGDAEALIAPILAAAARIRADLFTIFFVRSDSPFAAALARSPLAQRPGYARSIEGLAVSFRDFPSWDSFAASLSTSLKSKIRYKMKRLRTLGSVEFGFCRTVEDAMSVIDWVFANKRRWSRDRGHFTAYLEGTRVRDFFSRLAALQLGEGHDSILVAYVKFDGRPIAATINIAGDRTFEYFITTYDEDFKQYSPGEALVEFLAKHCCEHRLDLDFRMLPAGYKERWSNRKAIYTTHTRYMTRRGRLHAVERFAQRAMRAIRRRLPTGHRAPAAPAADHEDSKAA